MADFSSSKLPQAAATDLHLSAWLSTLTLYGKRSPAQLPAEGDLQSAATPALSPAFRMIAQVLNVPLNGAVIFIEALSRGFKTSTKKRFRRKPVIIV